MSQFEQIPDNGLSPLAREHGFKIVFPSGAGGLSPLARGTRIHADAFTCAGRFIPAGAGNTRWQYA